MLEKGKVVFGNWTVEETIGSGAFGTVYKIKKEEFGRVYYSAMKVLEIPQDKEEHNRLRREGMDDASISTYYSQIAQDFIKEIELLSSLDGITNIVDYKDHTIEANDNMGYTIYIKMQLLTPIANTLLNADGSVRFMEIEEILKLGKDMCSALEVCEKKKIIHRDIKIDNIFLSENGDYKLGDFGIARQLEATQGEMSKKGTVLYMAPEVFRGENYDKTVDIYSLGIVLYRLFNKNRAPFFPNYPDPIKFSDKEVANARRLKGDALPDIIGISAELNAVLKKACAFNASDRYQSASELKTALELVETAVAIPVVVAPEAPTVVEMEEKTESAFAPAFVAVEPVTPVAENTVDEDATVGVFNSTPIASVEPVSPIVEDTMEEEKTESVFGNEREAILSDSFYEKETVTLESFDEEKTESVFDSTPVDTKEDDEFDDEKKESVFAPVIDDRKKESQKNTEKSKTKKKPIVIILAVLVVIAILITTVIVVPNGKYQEALELMDSGKFTEAIAAFEELNGYKDSTDKIEECKTAILDKQYNDAIALMGTGNYAEAIFAFEALNDYKDCAEKIEECNIGILEAQYDEAVASWELGYVKEALCMFSSLGNYKDSKRYFSEILSAITVRETISAEYYTTVAVKSDGTVVAAGSWASSISGWTDIVSVCTALDHVVGLKSDGTVVAVGVNDYGQCNVSGWTDIVAISADSDCTIGLKSDGTVCVAGVCFDSVYDWTNIIAISAGYGHIVGLKSDGTVVATGGNWSGQCDVSDWTDIVAISAGDDHTVGLKSDGTVVATEYIGDNYNGQCNVSDWTDIIAVSAGSNHTIGLKSDGSVVAVGGSISSGECNVSDWTDIVAVSAGFCHTIGLKSDGTVLFVGDSWYYQKSNVSNWRNIRLPDNN